MTKQRIGVALRLIVAAAFVYAGIVKVLDPSAFLSSILTFEVLPHTWAVVSALFIPYLEVVAALALALGILRGGAQALIGGLLILFVGLVVQAWLRGLSIDCGCFGSHEISSGWGYIRKIGENALLLGLLVASARLERAKSG